MKQMKSFLTLALAITALAGCNKENEIPGMGPEATGVPTYAAFTVNVKSTANTRATDEAAGDVVEQTINDVRLFIFNQGGVLENTEKASIASGTTTVGIQTTTGQKTIYAVANAKDDMVLPLGSTLAQFKELAVNAGTTSVTSNDNIAATGAFAMIGVIKTTLTAHGTAVAAQGDPIAITVSRGAAKVQMQYNPATVTKNPSLQGAFSDPKYLLAQMNKTMFLPREGYELTPNGTFLNQADASPNDGTYDHLTTVPADMSTGKDAVNPWDNTFVNSFYTAENVNQTPYTGNTTFVLVQLKYVPDAGEVSGGPIDPSGTFYVAFDKTTHMGQIYSSEGDCDAAVGGSSGTLVKKTYTDGLMYYRVNLRDITKSDIQQKYCVLRNHYYKVNITSINSLGGESTTDPDVVVPTDPETPLETATFISANITVAPWNPIIMNEPLG